MKQQICIKLKPLLIEFYSQKDCGINCRYSVIIQENNTIYKSGIIKSEKTKYLQLASLSWMEFMIDKNEANSYISIVLTKHVEDMTLLQSPADRNSQKGHRQFVQYKSMLPIHQLRRIPLNKKKKFNFPLMYEGEIKAQGQFKILITQNRNSQQDPFTKIDLKQNQKTADRSKIEDKNRQNRKWQNQGHIIKAKVSDTIIMITPDLFRKKAEQMNIEEPASCEKLLDLDLIKKFEMLNKKFSSNDEPSDESLKNENQSVWEDEQQNEKSKNIVMNKYYNYEVIKQQKQQEQQAQY